MIIRRFVKLSFSTSRNQNKSFDIDHRSNTDDANVGNGFSACAGIVVVGLVVITNVMVDNN